MEHPNPISNRKDDHIRINLEENVQSGISTGLEKYSFEHCALPELDFEEIETGQTLLGKIINAPIIISSMTGGAERARSINAVLAAAAQHKHIALGLGSQRAALELSDLQDTFKVRQYAPDILLFANLGAVQLNYERNYIEFCQKAVDMVGADALYLHLNPLQEALQPEGDVHFKGLLNKIEKVVQSISVPVLIKEVGWGISAKVAQLLVQVGVSGIDVAGAGGTSWSQVEMFRMSDVHKAHVAASFQNWGISTADSLVQVKKAVPNSLVFASGGIRNGLDMAKCLALGAKMVGIASPFLKAALVSEQETIDTIDELIMGLKITMFVTGSKDLAALTKNKLKEA
jgi:isopentenyl-diphosphate Delta-isomerase